MRVAGLGFREGATIESLRDMLAQVELRACIANAGGGTRLVGACGYGSWGGDAHTIGADHGAAWHGFGGRSGGASRGRHWRASCRGADGVGGWYGDLRCGDR